MGGGNGKKRNKGTDRGTETGERKEKKEKGKAVAARLVWTKLIHLKAKCPNPKTLNYTNPDYNSLQVKTNFLILQPLQGLYSSRSLQMLSILLSWFDFVALFRAQRHEYIFL